MGESRITVTIEELGIALRLWIRGSPPYIWKRDQQYEELRMLRRHDPTKAPDPRSDLAAYLTDRFVQVGWEVMRPESENIFEGIGEGTNAHPRRGRGGES